MGSIALAEASAEIVRPRVGAQQGGTAVRLEIVKRRAGWNGLHARKFDMKAGA